jgi:hypothetical protein
MNLSTVFWEKPLEKFNRRANLCKIKDQIEAIASSRTKGHAFHVGRRGGKTTLAVYLALRIALHKDEQVLFVSATREASLDAMNTAVDWAAKAGILTDSWHGKRLVVGNGGFVDFVSSIGQEAEHRSGSYSTVVVDDYNSVVPQIEDLPIDKMIITTSIGREDGSWDASDDWTLMSAKEFVEGAAQITVSFLSISWAPNKRVD